jgi:sec-independent protein translocase protein TatA
MIRRTPRYSGSAPDSDEPETMAADEGHGVTSPPALPYPRWSSDVGCVEVLVGEFSPWHWLLVAFIALILFGPKKLPELGKGLAEGIRGFKEGLKDQPPTQASNEQNKNTEAKS